MTIINLDVGRRLAYVVLIAATFILIGVGSAMAYPAATTADLNMRSGPGTQFSVIAAIPRGGRVEVLGCSRGWCDVVWAGRRGYASERFLSPAVAPRSGGSFEIIIPFPGIQPAPPPPRHTRPDRPRRAECTDRGLRRFLGERASRRTVDEAQDRSRARTVRVVRPGDFITRDIRRDRLTIEVDRRQRIVELRCY
ncbi:MAG: SH3 domain-containing protein [Salinarimonas sp.]|nr:SH3 domain-containing protein [Salinarimonas sp.]